MTHGRRLLLKLAHTVHVYTTLFGLVLLLFFAVTGFILNHEDWFRPEDPHRRTTTGTVPVKLLEGPDKLAVVELLRKDHGITAALDSFEKENDSFRVVFKAPAREIIATIQEADGQTTVSHEFWGLVSIMTDLHRGKTSGTAWALVIDGVAILFVVVAVTGLILWSSLRSRGKYGLLVMALGLAVGLAVYFAFVPQ
jgi:hypothetical protein